MSAEKADAYGIEALPNLSHQEDATDAKLDAFSRGQVATGYETITILQTIKKFKMCFAVCFAATFAGATDGYQSASLPLAAYTMLNTDIRSLQSVSTETSSPIPVS